MSKHKNEALVEEAAARLSLEPAEVLVAITADGSLIAQTHDGNVMVINDDLDPAVQFLVPPRPDYSGFPVLYPAAAPVPAGISADDLKAVVKAVALTAPAEPAEVTGPPAGDEGTPPVTDTLPELPDSIDLASSVKEILKAVGDDKDLAAAVLVHENAAKNPRSTLQAGLTEVTGPPAGDEG